MTNLKQQTCQPIPAGTPALDRTAVAALLAQIPNWTLNDTGNGINRIFRFKNYYETMAFVNALAWIAHREDHHPDIEVGYNRCLVRFSTHSVKGLSNNDFICAAKLNALFGE